MKATIKYFELDTTNNRDFDINYYRENGLYYIKDTMQLVLVHVVRGITWSLDIGLKDIFEITDKESVKDVVETNETNKITEDFALKMLAISRANANSIKVNEFLNKDQ